MSNLSQYIAQESETVKQIYEWHEAMNIGKPPRKGRLGASIIGHECDRYLWFSYRKLFATKFNGRMLRLFETGHLEEPRLIRELRGIGCTVYDKDEETGKQFEFTAHGGHFVCYPDGVILGLPEAPKTWHIGEFKTMGGTEDQKSKDFEKVKKDGVQKGKPLHYAQMQCGMGLAKLSRAIYLAKKKATDELYGERIRYDSTEYKRLLERAKRIIESINPPERCATRPDDFRCRFCDAYDICWGNGDKAVPLPCKTCRSCCHATPVIDDTDEAKWSCAKHGCWLDRAQQQKGCDDHLLLPGLLTFAEPTDAGSDWIEFTNTHDGAIWKHGKGAGAWTTDELITTPGPLDGTAKQQPDQDNNIWGTILGDDSIDNALIKSYRLEETQLLWEGRAEHIEAAIQVTGVDKYMEGAPSALYEGNGYACYEYEQRFMIIFRPDSTADIWMRREAA